LKGFKERVEKLAEDQARRFSLRRLNILFSCLTIGALSFLIAVSASSWIAITGRLAGRDARQNGSDSPSRSDRPPAELQSDPVVLAVGSFLALTWLLAVGGIFISQR